MPEKVICMISGGGDSAVASYLLIRKGFIPIFVCFNIYPYVTSEGRRTAFDIVMKLKEYSKERPLRMYIVPHGEDLETIMSNCPRRLTCIICRRMMFRKAERIANMEGAKVIVTGESLGQKASQTLVNLGVTAEALEHVSLIRPLIGMNKLEIEGIARKIGIYEIATTANCTAPPKKPATRAKLEQVKAAEKNIDVEGLINDDLTRMDIINIK